MSIVRKISDAALVLAFVITASLIVLKVGYDLDTRLGFALLYTVGLLIGTHTTLAYAVGDSYFFWGAEIPEGSAKNPVRLTTFIVTMVFTVGCATALLLNRFGNGVFS